MRLTNTTSEEAVEAVRPQTRLDRLEEEIVQAEDERASCEAALDDAEEEISRLEKEIEAIESPDEPEDVPLRVVDAEAAKLGWRLDISANALREREGYRQ